MTNIVVSDLEPHDLTWVKSNFETWAEPTGIQAPIRQEAWDPAAAGDPSVRVPRTRRREPAEAPMPEEVAEREPPVAELLRRRMVAAV